ncbi:DUF4864 domain-containing protein [uncultured Lentibacter sp.]|uniref:DUF4864 domain-containing protein n=1 Tax=uncultured Lentibacter sp. TaxID=1659309 RepID=UPI0026174EE9|nr:DUF4864 domain-containing protein [uncultured Lentibacter sp.]
MKQILLVVTMVLALWVRPAAADDVAVQGVISAQIEAFKADDFARAFTFASPTIQDVFRTPENFGAMVKNGYPMVWRPVELRYLEARVIAGQLWQKVLVKDAAGERFLLDYRMINTAEGWRIDAVQLLELPEVSA